MHGERLRSRDAGFGTHIFKGHGIDFRVKGAPSGS